MQPSKEGEASRLISQKRRSDIFLNGKLTPLESMERAFRAHTPFVRGRNRIIVEERKPLPQAVYSSDQKDLIAFFNSVVTTSEVIGQASRSLSPKESLVYRNYDLYTHRLRGLSLSEVAKMPLPLSDDNIKGVNRFLRYWHTSRFLFSRNDHQVQEMAVALPALSVVQSRDQSISSGLKPLCDRLVNYFGYYADFFTDLHIDYEQEALLLKTLSFVGKRLREGLYTFLPGYLGISPASVIKLLEERSVNGYADIAWRLLKGECADYLDKCSPDNNLPSELKPYQRYNAENDKQISQVLNPYYQNLFDRRELPGSQSQAFADLHRYQRDLRFEVLDTRDKFLRIDPHHPIISEVMVASPRKGTLMFVLCLSQSQARLALEVNDTDRFFGIPSDMYFENIHIGDLLARDFLPPILGFISKKRPQNIPLRVIGIVPKSKEVPISENRSKEDDAGVLDISGSDIVVSKKRRFLQNLTEPALPQQKTGTETMVPIRVEYSRQAIVESCSQRLSTKQLEQIVQIITTFEFGGSKPVAVKGMPNYIRLKVGDRRIILELKNGNPGQKTYFFKGVEERSKVYKKLMRP